MKINIEYDISVSEKALILLMDREWHSPTSAKEKGILPEYESELRSLRGVGLVRSTSDGFHSLSDSGFRIFQKLQEVRNLCNAKP